ncbi:MAG: 50S ribosomal protein L32, partial [Candidatus Zixiibacteriota bacterium]
MPLPKRRHSKQRGRKRRTHYVATAPALVECLHCGEKKLFHHICPACGYYRG